MGQTSRESIAAYDAQADHWADYLKSGKNLAHRYIEKPAMYDLLPDLAGKTVLCIGCGTGEEVAELAKRKPKRLIGIDLSEGMIRKAKEQYPKLDLRVMDMEELDFPNQTFDFIYSSLTIHYVPDWTPVLAEWAGVLKRGGEILLSAQHPAFFGAEYRYHRLFGYRRNLGYSFNRLFRRVTTHGNYFDTRRLVNHHRAGGRRVKLINYHQSFEAMLRYIQGTELQVVTLTEPRPTAEAAADNPRWAELAGVVPQFVIFKLRKP